MSLNKNDNGFDELLRRALQGHLEQVPVNFTLQVLGQIEKAQQQRILSQIILRERLALAGSILLAAASLIIAAVFYDVIGIAFQRVAEGLSAQVQVFGSKIPQTVKAISNQWQFYMPIFGVFGFAIYNLVDLLAGDRLRMV